MKIIIVSATMFEIAPLLHHFDTTFNKENFFTYKNAKHTVTPIVTGVGSLLTAFAIARTSQIKDADVVFNVGICGSFNRTLQLGEVVEITKDRFADLGVENADGSFSDIFDLELADKNQFPYADGWLLPKKNKIDTYLKKVSAITVNKVHGLQTSIDQTSSKYNADVESMEGAGFVYACNILDVANHQIRAISNYVEPRNKANWNIELAIDNLNKRIIEILS